MADPKQKALQDARRAQARFKKGQKQLDQDGQVRRESFEFHRREVGPAPHVPAGIVVWGDLDPSTGEPR
jgi:hypothetical protein